MQSSTTVFTGTTHTGLDITIRYPQLSDVAALHAYINTLSQERTFISYQGEEISLADEQKYVEKLIEQIENAEATHLLVIHKDELIGTSGITLQDRTNQHIGIFGISLAKGFRDQGVGTLLMQHVIAEAEKKLPRLEIISLHVFARNPRAQHLYEKFGFEVYGKLPNGVKLENSHDDAILMYKAVKH